MAKKSNVLLWSKTVSSMSLPRNFVAISCLLALAACGFSPLYSKNEATGQVAPYAIHVEAIVGGRPAQELEVRLGKLLNPLSEKKQVEYRLSTQLAEVLSALVTQRDGRISRYNLAYTANYQLIDVHTGKQVFSGRSKVVGSYDAEESDFATHAAQQDTAIKVMREMAKDIKVRLMAYLVGAKKKGKIIPPEAPREPVFEEVKPVGKVKEMQEKVGAPE